VKYYSVPNPGANAECGECCLKPGLYKFWKLFEPKLLEGNCASLGFTKYKSTETDGVSILSVTNDRYVRDGTVFSDSGCPEKLQAVYADMHDGDKKEVIISGTSMTIKPSGNDQNWVVNTKFDPKSCSAVVDFNVPGKPNPPPVSLVATFLASLHGRDGKTEFDFADPTGKLPAGPLNRWVQLSVAKEVSEEALPCPASMKAVFTDMHDGDKKEVTIAGRSMTITPSGNNQTWVVQSHIDPKLCNAVINFNVPGKPGPPPVNLMATLWNSVAPEDGGVREKIYEFEFTDPSGTLASSDSPLNRWVLTLAIDKENTDKDVLI